MGMTSRVLTPLKQSGHYCVTTMLLIFCTGQVFYQFPAPLNGMRQGDKLSPLFFSVEDVLLLTRLLLNVRMLKWYYVLSKGIFIDFSIPGEIRPGREVVKQIDRTWPWMPLSIKKKNSEKRAGTMYSSMHGPRYLDLGREGEGDRRRQIRREGERRNGVGSRGAKKKKGCW